MQVENATYPTPAQMEAVLARGGDRPIVMLNLLKFRDKAEYTDGRPDDISGREAYMRYAQPMRAIVEAGGGRFLFAGDVSGLVLGEVGDLWDTAALVEYPSRQGFFQIASAPEVQQIGVHRAAGLAGQLLIELTEGGL